MKNFISTSWKEMLKSEHLQLNKLSKKAFYFTFILFSLFCFQAESNAQCQVNCQNLNLSLEASGYGLITPDLLLENNSCNPSNFTLVIVDESGNQLPGNLVDCTHLNQTLQATITHTILGVSCTGNILVEDKFSPTIQCEEMSVSCTSAMDPETIGYPTVSDNCSSLDSADLSYTDNNIDLACYTVYNGQEITSKIERTWSVTDDSGNTTSCIQTIYLERITLAQVVFPPSLDGFDAPALDCGADPMDLSLTGEPLINGQPIPNGGGYCELIVNYTDQEVPICLPGSKRVVRTWSVIDMCSQQFILGAQTIKVLDQTPPTILPLADITVGADTSTCDANVILPQTTATDDCSYYTITPQTDFGSGPGPFTMPVGDHIVTYVAEDDCGNTSTTTMTVSVIDNVIPVAICDVTTSVSLSSFGTGFAFPPTFDAGSNDNCGITSYLISRDGVAYSDSLQFNCDDIVNSPIQIKLRVIDAAGNQNECNADVWVQEQVPPVIGCPPNVTLECGDDFTDLSRTYEAIASDNCGIERIEYDDEINLNSCSVGTVDRTWIAYDYNGNSSTCLQTISLVDNTPMIIAFPENIDLYTCGIGTDTTITGSPLITYDCEDVDISYTDSFYGSAYPACYTIIRHWSVINWCEHTSDPTSGIWEASQEIYVHDTIAPVLTCPQDLTVGITNQSCTDGAIILAQVIATDCNPNVTITNDSPYAVNGGPDASGTYPVGVHLIEYTAEDGCGNTSTCEVTVTVQDATPPTPICITGITLPLGPGGFVDITEQNINFGSFDNCTNQSDLVVTIDKSHFTCADVGDNEVTLTVKDDSDNVAECTTIVTIVDGNPMTIVLDYFPVGQYYNITCGVSGGSGSYSYAWSDAASSTGSTLPGMLEGSYAVTVTDLVSDCYAIENITIGSAEYREIQGVITTVNDRPLENIEVVLSGDMNLTANTDQNGMYNFPGVVAGGNYTVLPNFGDDIRNGVTTFDLVLITKHILNLQDLNSPYKLIAADINNSGSITTFDLVLMRQMILDQIDQFPNNTAWRFVDSNFQFTDIEDPFVDDFPELTAYSSLSNNQMNTDFVAIKVGDVNDNAVLNFGEAVDRNANGTLDLVINDRHFEVGDEVVASFRASDFADIAGFQLALNFDGNMLEFEDLNTAELEGFSLQNLGLKKVDQGILGISWNAATDLSLEDDNILFSFRFTAKTSGNLQEAIRMNSTNLVAEAYAGLDKLNPELLDVSIKFEKTSLTGETVLEQNFPNPFSDITTIPFYLEKSGNLNFYITDITGKRNLIQSQFYEKGNQLIQVNLAEYNVGSGIYYYHLELESGEVFTKKMIVLK